MEQSYGFPSNFFPRQIFFLSPISEKTFVLEQSLNEIHSFDQKVGNPEIDAKLRPYTKNSYGSQKAVLPLVGGQGGSPPGIWEFSYPYYNQGGRLCPPHYC